MTAKARPENCPKFTISLKARTSRKRLLEAKHELEGLYPFGVDEKKILMLRTDKKGRYDVYLSKEEIRNEPDIRKICLAALLCAIFIAVLALAARNATLKNTESLRAEKELEKQKQEEAKIQKEKEEKLFALKKEYDEKKKLECEKIYPCIERIYSVMQGNTTIENIVIQKNAFTVEVTTKDAVGILAEFEESQAFASVKMNRTTVKNGVETVAYSGEFSRFWNEADEESSLDGRIRFYETELTKIKARSKAMQTVSLSEYIKNIRGTMHKNLCGEQYIQLKGKDNGTEIEVFVLSNSRSLLNFIKEIQEGDENLIDINSFTFRNSDSRDRLQTTICFDTGIELKRNDSLLAEYIDKKIELSEIDRIFYKSPSVRVAAIKSSVSKNNASAAKVSERAAPVNMKTLCYIGMTKVDGKNYVIATDDEMEGIYKLALAETETEGDFCVKNDDGYRAKIRGEYYEVRK